MASDADGAKNTAPRRGNRHGEADHQKPRIPAWVALAQPVAGEAAEEGAGNAGDEADGAEPHGDVGGGKAVHPSEQGRQPCVVAEGDEGNEGEAQHEVAEGADAPKEPERLEEGRLCVVGNHLASHPPWLWNHPFRRQREQYAGQPHRDERDPPAPGVRDQATGEETEQRAGGHPKLIDGKRRGALLLRVHVRNQGMRRWRESRLADTDTHPRQHQMHEVLRQATCRRHRAPKRHRHRDDVDPMCPVRQSSDGDAQRRIERRERHARDHAELPIGQTKVCLDGLDEDRNDLAIDEVEEVQQRQRAESRSTTRCRDRKGQGAVVRNSKAAKCRASPSSIATELAPCQQFTFWPSAPSTGRVCRSIWPVLGPKRGAQCA